MKSFVILALVATASAIRLRDEDNEGDLPTLVDTHDVNLDKKMKGVQSLIQQTTGADSEIQEKSEMQLDQALRNAEQGEFGRALAVSKLSQIKEGVQTMEKNLVKESQAIIDEVETMKEKHRPTLMDTKIADKFEKRASKVVAQIPNINKLENALEIQEEDAELASISKHLSALSQKTKDAMVTGNKEIQKKMGSLPDADKVMTEKDYEDSMSFILKH